MFKIMLIVNNAYIKMDQTLGIYLNTVNSWDRIRSKSGVIGNVAKKKNLADNTVRSQQEACTSVQ